MKISDIKARQVLDSRGLPTIEVDITTDGGAFGRASVPSGASTGDYEAHELRDGDPANYLGKGVLKAIGLIHDKVAPELKGLEVTAQRDIDEKLMHIDATPNKSHLGANAILAVSLASARAAADYYDMPLFRYVGGVQGFIMPTPMMNIINGGAHSDAPIAFQEFMIRPIGAEDFEHALRMGSEVFHHLKRILKERGHSTAVGDEGGFAPLLSGVEDALNVIVEAINAAGYNPSTKGHEGDISLALDCAASEFYVDGVYDYSVFEGERGQRLTAAEQVEYLAGLVAKFPIDSIEDGMDQNDWTGWEQLTARLGGSCQLVGDDLFVTNVKFLKEGIARKCANSILIKLNQIGTLSETLDTVNLAHSAGYKCIISHRSGETEDSFIADLSVATNAGQIKTGSLSRSERIAKYNQLIRIEESLKNR